MGMLDGKTAIVTGGARGIGLAIARRYVAEGARVVIADIDESAGKAAAAALGSGGALRAHRRRRGGRCAQRGRGGLRRCGRSRHSGQQCRDHPHGGFPRHRRGRLRPRAAHQPEGHVPGRAGGGQADGRAGQGRQAARRDRQHELDQRARRDPQSGAVLRLEGRRRPAHQGDGAVAGAVRHPRQCDRAGLDHDRHPARASRPTRRRRTGCCRARRSAASPSRTRSPRSRRSSPRRMRATSPARPSTSTAAGSR